MIRRAWAVAGGLLLSGLLTMLMVARPGAGPAPSGATAPVAAAEKPLPPLEVLSMPAVQTPSPETRTAAASRPSPHTFCRQPRSFSPRERQILDAVAACRANQIVSAGESLRYAGSEYNATFDPEGLTFTAASGHLRLSLESLRCGSEDLALGGPMAPSVDAVERAVVYGRGDVRERYVVRPESVEQIFVIDRLPVQRGEVDVRVNVQTPLKPPASGTKARSLSFAENGSDVLSISQAVVFDAANRRLELDLAWDGSAYAMSIPATWVEAAALPITIDPKIGPEINFGNSPIGVVMAPRPDDIAYNATDDEWLVIWNEQIGATVMDYDLFGQRVSGAGALLGSRILIDATGAYECAVAWSPTVNQYLAVWSHDPVADAGDSDTQILGRRIAADGTFPSWAFIVNDSPDWDVMPDVAWGSANWLVAYTTATDDNLDALPDEFDVRARSVAATEAVGTEFAIDDSPSSDADAPSLAYEPNSGTFLAVWESGTAWVTTGSITLSPSDIAARRCSETAVIGSIFTVDSDSVECWMPEVMAGNAQWLVVWMTNGTTYDVHARLVNNDGTFPAAAFVVEDDGNDQDRPRVAFSPITNDWFVSWDDYPIPGNPHVYGNRVSSTGVVLGATKYLLSNDVLQNGIQPVENMHCISPLPNTENAILVFWGWGNDPFEWHGRRFSLDYIPPGAPTGVSPVGGTGDTTPTLVWTAATDTGGSGVDHYDWRLSNFPSFTPTILVGSSSGLSDTVPVALPPGTYYWQVQATDAAGNVGSYSVSRTFTIDPALNLAPSVGDPNQYKTDNSTPIAVGGTTNQVEVHPGATVVDPEGDNVRLDVEVKPVNVLFTGEPTQSSAYVPSGTVLRAVVTLPEGSYHWQYRAVDANGKETSWFSFGGNDEPTGTDFAISFGGHSGRDATCAAGVPASSVPWRMPLAAVVALMATLLIRKRS